MENQENWDKWLVETGGFLYFSQSWAWGDILIAEGKKVERLAIVDEKDEILAQAQVVYSNLPFGMKYAFCPKGPIYVAGIRYQVSGIFDSLYNYFKKQNILFLRMEPNFNIPNTKYKIQNTSDVNPSATLILDLENSEEEILKNMHSKTRYNIRLAERKGVEIKREKNFVEFLRLMKMTGERDGFRLHFKNHYEKILDSDMSIELNAYFEGKIITTAVFLKFGNVFTYLYGASDYKFRKVMAPNLLQWEGIKLGKSLGCKKYDFFGIAPAISPPLSKGRKQKGFAYDKKHQYSGVTRFKLGFGGEYKKDVGTFDIAINKNKYFLYKVLRKIRRVF